MVVDNPSNLVLVLSTKTIVKLSDHGIDVQPTELLLVVHRQKHLQETAETKYLIKKRAMGVGIPQFGVLKMC